MSPPSWISLSPPMPFHPSRSSQSTSLSSLGHAATSHQLSVLPMVMCMFQYCSFSLSHLLLPGWVHKSGLYVCDSVPGLQMGSLVPSFEIPHTHTHTHIYIYSYAVSIFLSLAYFTLCNRLLVHPAHQNWLKFAPFHGCVIFHWPPRWLSGKEILLTRQEMQIHPRIGRIYSRRKWQTAPVSLPGKSQGQRSLVGSRPWVTKSQIRLNDWACNIPLYWYSITNYIYHAVNYIHDIHFITRNCNF